MTTIDLESGPLTLSVHRVDVFKDFVEYRTETSAGTRVVRVYLSTPTPRILAQTEHTEGHQTPMSLFLDEIILFANDALARRHEQFNSKEQ